MFNQVSVTQSRVNWKSGLIDFRFFLNKSLNCNSDSV